MEANKGDTRRSSANRLKSGDEELLSLYIKTGQGFEVEQKGVENGWCAAAGCLLRSKSKRFQIDGVLKMNCSFTRNAEQVMVLLSV